MSKSYSLIFYQLMRPFAYLIIKHPDKKIYDWLIPGFFSLVSTFLIYQYVGVESAFSDNGIIDRIVGLVANLPGFFIAALAAVATFNKPTIDEVMGAEPPKIKVRRNQKYEPVGLTRRWYLCLLFSFLTAESLVIVVVASVLIGGGLMSSPSNYAIFNVGAMFILSLAFWQLIFSTFFGLFYLGDKLHYPKE